MNVSVSSESRKGSATFPDIRPAIEETIEQEPISAEAHCAVQENPGSSVVDVPNQVGFVGPCRFALHGPGISKARP